MIVVGGVYREYCARPRWDRIFGSGGRAATAIAALSPDTVLHGYANEAWLPGLQASAAACGYLNSLTAIRQKITFEYLHPLATPNLFPVRRRKYASLEVRGETVLRFGFVEGDAIVKAKHAVYDPQTGKKPEPFKANGSKADHLAVVLNAKEAALSTGRPPLEAGAALLREWSADVVIIKLGTEGALLFERDQVAVRVPAYQSNKVFKIGSGDVFSALFAFCWGERGMGAEEAARHASAGVADYVETRSLPMKEVPNVSGRRECHSREKAPVIYLAGPFFDLPQRWFIEETLAVLEGLGAEVFSPIHHVGAAENVQNVAFEDLEGLRDADVVLALADSRDPGTIFEVGFARALDPAKPVIVLAERFGNHELTMFTGTGCDVTNDFSTAIYKSLWAAY